MGVSLWARYPCIGKPPLWDVPSRNAAMVALSPRLCLGRGTETRALQGYLAHKKAPPPRTLQ